MPGPLVPRNSAKTPIHRRPLPTSVRQPAAAAANAQTAATRSPRARPKSLPQRALDFIKLNPKRALLAAGGLTLACGLCAIPGAPAIIVGLLLIGGFSFAAYQLYQAAAKPSPQDIQQTVPASKSTGKPKPATGRSSPKSNFPIEKTTQRLTIPRPTPPAKTKAPTLPHQAKVKPAALQTEALPVIDPRLASRCNEMSRPGTYGDYPEIIALSQVLGWNIYVYSIQNGRKEAASGIMSCVTQALASHPHGGDIHLIHRNHGASSNLNHYDRFRVKPDSMELSQNEWDTPERRVTVQGDGNCLFRAVAEVAGVSHEKARADAVGWMRLNEDFSDSTGFSLLDHIIERTT
jgi:hypothetical protein